MYDEERYEEQLAFGPRHRRDRAQPDGMSSPPELAPQRASAPPECPHPRLRNLPGDLGTSTCLTCGAVFGPENPKS